jgi:hypothetical protein
MMKKSLRITLLTVAIAAVYMLSACGAPASTTAPSAAQLSPNSSVDGPKVLAVEVAFSGVVESMSGSQWIVDGHAVIVTPQTLTNGSIQVGDVVKVEGTVGQDGAINTTRVQNSLAVSAGAPAGNLSGYSDPTQTPDPSSGNEQEVFGVIEAMTDTTVTIDGVIYQLTNLSEVDGLLAVGDEVKIHYIVNTDGTLTIREIELRSSQDDDNDNGNVNVNNNGNGNANDDNGNGSSNVNDNGNVNDDDDNGNSNINDNDNDDNSNDNDDNDNDDNDNDDNDDNSNNSNGNGD